MIGISILNQVCNMKFTSEHIRNFVESNPKLVSRKESARYPGLYVLKYKNKVFYDNLWTPELMEMRGLVVDEDYNVVVYPFTKIFNRFENGIDIDRNEIVTAVRKVNGFLGCVTVGNGRLIYSTTGSLDSDYVKLVEKHLGNNPWFTPSMSNSYTWMFEICDPSDPHIIYEKKGAYLIGGRSIYSRSMVSEKDLDYLAKEMEVMRPSHEQIRFSDLVEKVKFVAHEGFVVYGKLNNGEMGSLKIKSPYYLTNKFLARVRPEKFLTLIEDGSIKRRIDEEYYPLIDYLVLNKDHFAALTEQSRISYIKEFLNENNFS